LEVIKTKMQAMNASDGSCKVGSSSSEAKASDPSPMASKQPPPLTMIQFTIDLYRLFGIKPFVRGIEISALQSSLEKGLYFLSYTLLKKLHRSLFNTTTSSSNRYVYLLYGYLSGWVHLPITMPLDAWKAQVQSRPSPNAASNRTLLIQLLRDPSFEFYKGLSSYYVLCMTPAIQYWIYEQLKILRLRQKQSRAVGRQSSQLSFGESFVLGMISRTISTLLVYPYIRRKVLLQTKQKVSDLSLSSSRDHELPVDPMASTTSSIRGCDVMTSPNEWNRFVESIKQLYYGVGPELTRGILSASIMLMVKERIALLVRQKANWK
jgi:solute carrier family 25 (peroxisomal adenine nucleotide transporter), member 17